MYQKFGKRAIDLVLSFCGLVILSPIYLILIIAILIDDPGPVFFTQKRIGKNKDGKEAFFKLYKTSVRPFWETCGVHTHMLCNPN